jgi:hypothetical protein
MDPYTVKAKEPTILDGQSHRILAGTDLLIGFKVSLCGAFCTCINPSCQVDTAYIVPGQIELDRFNDALARTLSVHPVYAGHLERPKGTNQPWKVRDKHVV